MTSKSIIKQIIIKFCSILFFMTSANASIYIERDVQEPKNEIGTMELPLPELKDGLFPKFNLERENGCLAVAIYYEARGESISGQIAVGQVILNRVASRKYPNNICDVVYQNAHKRNRCQFSFACDGKIEDPRNKNAWVIAMNLASIMIGDSTHTYYARSVLLSLLLDRKLTRSTHYHADYVRPGWSKRLERSGQIGQHVFYISQRVWS